MHFTPCQAQAFHLLQEPGNVFLTGAAGTGKSFLLRCFLQDKPLKSHPVLASTGTAALLVDGRTFHSFFSLGIMEGGRGATVARALATGTCIKRLRDAECIVIDEVSMLSGETLAAAEQIARQARENEAPWGGLRVIAVGDFAQLPPVHTSSEQKDWAFAHPVWEYTGFQSVYLRTPVRTTESRLLSVLNAIRAGQVTEEVHAFLESRRLDPGFEFDGTKLYPRRKEADVYNAHRLGQIESPMREYHTEYTGEARGIEQLKKQCPIPEILQLKVGALVMLRKNDTSFPYKYVNGTLATVMSMNPDALTVQLLNGKTVTIFPEVFSLIDGNGRKRASAENFPVILAWATTIHKAQGASIDRLMVSIFGLWESGHAYVALSRAQSEAGLYIARWDPQSIFIDPLVRQFYAQVEAQWQMRAQSLPETQPQFTPSARKRPKAEVKIPNHKQTEKLLKEKRSLAEIAQILGWKEGTIITHIEKLLKEEVETPDIEYLRPDMNIFQAIAAGFEEHGTELLRPVYDHFEEQYSYDELKLVRLFLL